MVKRRLTAIDVGGTVQVDDDRKRGGEYYVSVIF